MVEHCVSSAKCRGFNSQGTHILTKNVYTECITCKSLWIKASAKCINLRFILIDHRYSLHSGLLCTTARMNSAFCVTSFICGVCARSKYITVLRAGCTGGKYTALRQNRQVADQWQSRIRMEQSVDVLSLKDVQLGFVYMLLQNFKWQMSYLFIFICDTFTEKWQINLVFWQDK